MNISLSLDDKLVKEVRKIGDSTARRSGLRFTQFQFGSADPCLLESLVRCDTGAENGRRIHE